MALSNDPLLQRRQNSQGLTRQLLNQPSNYVQAIQPINNPVQNVQNLASIGRQNTANTRPVPTQQQLNQWGQEARDYAYQADGLRGSFRRLLGQDPYTNNYPSASRTGTEIASIPPVEPSSSRTTNSNKVDTQYWTPEQAAKINAREGISPTSVSGVTRQLIDGVPTFSNVPNQDASGLGSIPSLRQSNIRDLLQQGTQQIPAYNQGTQYSTVEDATTGGYYQKRSADRANQRTMQRLTDANKEAWGLNRQATIDNSQLENNSLTRQLLGTQAETAQRINNLDRTIANFDASPQERLAALQTRNLLGQGNQRPQNNVVTKITEELPDGSKRERAVTIDPSTGEQVGGSNQQVSRSDISKLAQSTGRSEDEVINQLRALGVDIS